MKYIAITILLLIPYVLSQSIDDIELAKWIDNLNRNKTKTPIDLTPNNLETKDNSTSCSTSEGKEGECVPYYLCDPETRTVIDDGKDIIDIRLSACPHYLEICCQLTDMIVEKPPQHEELNASDNVRKNTDKELTACGWDNPGINPFHHKTRDDAYRDLYSNYGDFRFMVAVMKRSLDNVWSNGDYIGGGALIHPKVVLTTQHKLKRFNYKANELKCRAGEYDTQTEKEEYHHVDRNVNKIIDHEHYFKTSLYYDVSLLVLEQPYEIAPHIGTACLGTALPDTSSTCFSMGWGKDFKGTNESVVILKKVKLPLVEASRCEELIQSNTRLGKYFRLHRSLTCAGGEEGIDTCTGDGGSPLVCIMQTAGENTRYAVYGLVAYGLECGKKDVPGVYVNIPHVYSWIETQMQNENYNTSYYKTEN